MKKNGKLIVFEGTDGTGKATQTRLMAQRLRAENIPFREIDFPRYGNPFAEPARLYLNGALGANPGDVSAYGASVLYAVDRYASYREDWGRAYETGTLILANRYTTSNAVHQAAKLPPDERADYLTWLFDLEYHRLGLPAPDLVIYLDLSSELSERLLRQRQAASGTRADIHEQDAAYLRRCRACAQELVRSFHWQLVDCARGQELLRPEEIHQNVWELVRPILPQTD